MQYIALSSWPFIATVSLIRFDSISYLLMLVWILPAVVMGAFVGMLSQLLSPMRLPWTALCPSTSIPVCPTLACLTCLVWPLPSSGWYSTNVSGWLLHFTRLGVPLKTALLCEPPAHIPTLLVMIIVLHHVFNVHCCLRVNKLVQFNSENAPIYWYVGWWHSYKVEAGKQAKRKSRGMWKITKQTKIKEYCK